MCILLIMIGRLTLEQYARRAHVAAAEGDHSHFHAALSSFESAASKHHSAHAWLEIALLLTEMGESHEVAHARHRALQCDPTIANEPLYRALGLFLHEVAESDTHDVVLAACAAGGSAALIAGEHVLAHAPRLAQRCAKALSPNAVPISLVSRVWRLRAQTANTPGEAHAAWQFAIRETHFAGRQRYLLQYTHELLQAGALSLAKKQFTTLQQLGSLPDELAVNAQVLLARIQFASGNPHEAHMLLRTTNLTVGSEPVQHEATLLHADIARVLGDSATEAHHLGTLLHAHPELTERYVHALRENGNYAAALSALQQHPGAVAPDLHLLVEAEYAYHHGDHAYALELAHDVFERSGSVQAALLIAQSEEAVGGFTEAAHFYHHVVLHAPATADALHAASELLRLHEHADVLSERDVRQMAKHVLGAAEPWSPEAEAAERAVLQLERARQDEAEFLVN